MINFEDSYPIQSDKSWAIVDSTKLQCFMACPRRYFYEHALGWRPLTPSNHLIFGQAWHEALEHILINGFENKSLVEAFDKFMATYRATFPEATDDLMGGKTPENAMKALVQYVGHYAADLHDYNVLLTEVGGQVAIREDRLLSFKMDAVMQRVRDGALMVMEHKTGSRFTSLWEMQWSLSVQCGTYTYALDCMYHDPANRYGLIVNGAFFQPKKIDFHRVPVLKPMKMMNAWLNMVNAWYESLETEFEVLRNDEADNPAMYAFPMNPTACTDYGGCGFHDFCTSWANPLANADQPPYGYKVEYWNPLEQKTIKHRVDLKASA